MTTRGGEDIILRWVHVDLSGLSGAQKLAIRNEVRDRIRQHPKLVNTEVSVNMNHSNTAGLVKVATDLNPDSWLTSRTWSARIVRIFTVDDHDEAYDLVHHMDWVGIPPDHLHLLGHSPMVT
jgi:hypothetical protein